MKVTLLLLTIIYGGKNLFMDNSFTCDVTQNIQEYKLFNIFVVWENMWKVKILL